MKKVLINLAIFLLCFLLAGGLLYVGGIGVLTQRIDESEAIYLFVALSVIFAALLFVIVLLFNKIKQLANRIEELAEDVNQNIVAPLNKKDK